MVPFKGDSGFPGCFEISPWICRASLHQKSAPMTETRLLGCLSDKAATCLDSALPPQVGAQLCRRPCYCPWVPPRCPRGSPLVLDGCGCCKVCARRLGEPCDFLHVCDQSQGLVCDYSSASAGTGGTCNCEHGGAHFPRGCPHTPAQRTAQLQS